MKSNDPTAKELFVFFYNCSKVNYSYHRLMNSTLDEVAGNRIHFSMNQPLVTAAAVIHEQCVKNVHMLTKENPLTTESRAEPWYLIYTPAPSSGCSDCDTQPSEKQQADRNTGLPLKEGV